MSKLTLTTLPPEVRESIFSQALRSKSPQKIATPESLSLLATSRQIYHETHLLPFQVNTVAIPASDDSSTSATDKFLHHLSRQQCNAIRSLELKYVASTLDVAAACKVLKYLRLGNAEGDLDAEMAGTTLPLYDGSLQDVSIVISARDIAVSSADCAVGLDTALTAASAVFAWLRAFPTLRSLRVHIRLRKVEQFSKARHESFDQEVRESMKSAIKLDTSFEVDDGGQFFDELDLYPDSYMGVFGNMMGAYSYLTAMTRGSLPM